MSSGIKFEKDKTVYANKILDKKVNNIQKILKASVLEQR